MNDNAISYRITKYPYNAIWYGEITRSGETTWGPYKLGVRRARTAHARMQRLIAKYGDEPPPGGLPYEFCRKTDG